MYIPKSKISSPKYTSGGQFVFKQSKLPYIGNYYSVSDGSFFSGNAPNDKNSKELIRSTPKQIDNFVPKYYYPTPTENDYKNGFIVRYFLKKRNASFAEIIEISSGDYQKTLFRNGPIDTEAYASIKLNWKITGPLHDDFRDKNFPKAGIVETNQKLVKLKEKIFPGFSLFIKDYAQFAKPE
jgi:hypothetical protein